ncbi:MAG: hypothetical protein DMG67_14180 [Acidobacteria bacterium]|nr:MAG: hypothetical protein DMG67_14180 [Acidobacteriota bacterium]
MKRLRLLPILFGLLFVLVPLWAQQADFRPDYGLLNGRRYMNGYFGFSYRFPEGWTGSALKYPAVGESKMYPLFSANPQAASTSDVRYVSINADYLAPNTTIKAAKDFLEVAINAQAGPSGEFEALHTDKRYVFGGKQFYRVDMKAKPSPGSPVFYQTLICTIQHGYAITFSFMAANNDDLEELVRTMESLSFIEPGPMPGSAPTMVAQQQPAPVVSNTLASAPSTTTVTQAPSTVLPASAAGRSNENAAEAQTVQSAAIPEPAATAPQATGRTTPRRATATVSSSASEVPTAEVPQNEIPLNQVGSTSPATVTIAEVTPTQSANTSTVSTTNSEPVSQNAPPRPAAPSTLIPLGRTPQRTYPAPQTSSASPPTAPARSSPAPSARPQTSIPETTAISAAPAASTVAPAVLTQSAPPPSGTPPAASLQAENEPVARPSTSQPMIQPVAQTQAVEAKPVPTMTAAAATLPPSTTGAPMRVHIPPAELEQFVTRKTTPVYPMIAKAAGVQGMVVLDVVVDSKGTLQKVTIVNGSALLARAAEDALRQWRFKPYMVDGNPVEMESQIAMNFRLGR